MVNNITIHDFGDLFIDNPLVRGETIDKIFLLIQFFVFKKCTVLFLNSAIKNTCHCIIWAEWFMLKNHFCYIVLC